MAQPEFVRAVDRAYLTGVGAAVALLSAWLSASTSVILRANKARQRALPATLTAVYAALGYVGYGYLLETVTLWCMNRVAIVEPFVFHPWWARTGIPVGTILMWFMLLRRGESENRSSSM